MEPEQRKDPENQPKSSKIQEKVSTLHNSFRQGSQPVSLSVDENEIIYNRGEG